MTKCEMPNCRRRAPKWHPHCFRHRGYIDEGRPGPVQTKVLLALYDNHGQLPMSPTKIGKRLGLSYGSVTGATSGMINMRDRQWLTRDWLNGDWSYRLTPKGRDLARRLADRRDRQYGLDLQVVRPVIQDLLKDFDWSKVLITYQDPTHIPVFPPLSSAARGGIETSEKENSVIRTVVVRADTGAINQTHGTRDLAEQAMRHAVRDNLVIYAAIEQLPSHGRYVDVTEYVRGRAGGTEKMERGYSPYRLELCPNGSSDRVFKFSCQGRETSFTAAEIRPVARDELGEANLRLRPPAEQGRWFRFGKDHYEWARHFRTGQTYSSQELVCDTPEEDATFYRFVGNVTVPVPIQRPPSNEYPWALVTERPK